MLYSIVAALLLLHTVFWGLGLSWLVLPRAWQAVWWAFAAVLGFALQSAVVWAGAHTAMAGTNAYAVASELLPLAFLVVAARRLGRDGLRQRCSEVARAWPVLALVVLAGLLLLWPMAQRGGWTLTSSSLGSCDHADYAAGARVFQEFSRDDTGGFLGLTEVTRVGSAAGFFEFWLKLNHFTPSALIAHNATILRLQAYQLVSVSGVVVLLTTVPLVLLLARRVGLRRGQRLLVAALYAFSPLSAYAVHQGALGQIYAAHGIAVLTLTVLGLVERGRMRSEAWRYGAVAFASIWLLAGSYNFILTVALAPSGAWLLGRALLTRSVATWPRVAAVLATAFAATVVLFWGRYAGVVERFRLFDQFNFGWPVPHLWPGAWLGFVADATLRGLVPAATIVGSGLVVAAWVAGTWALARRRASAALTAVAFVLPVAAGWAILMWETRTRANASYDAFKILSVFLPCLLAGLCAWLAFARGARGRWLIGAGALVLGMNLLSGFAFARTMARPPLRVERTVVDLSRVETMARFKSLNMRIDDFWSRLWANCFLLRKPQYFETHTYEGRLNTALKGEWDLSDSLLHSMPKDAADYFAVNDRFHLERVAAPGRVRLEFGSGWHAIEGAGGNRWRWGAAEARVRVTNAAAHAVHATVRVKLRATTENAVIARLEGRELGRAPLSTSFHEIEMKNVTLPPGQSELEFAVEHPPGVVHGDPRVLGLALARLTVVAEGTER